MKSRTQKNEYSNEAELISKALQCLENKLRYTFDKKLNNSKDVSAFVRLQLAKES